MPDWFDLAAIGLCTWRLASLLVNEEGPFSVFLRLREAIGIEHDPDDRPMADQKGFLPKLFGCVVCMSVWTAAISYLIWWLSPVPVLIFAASAVAIMLQRWRDNA